MNAPNINDMISKRRTIAIISHPDAGKTTLTEKLLLYSGMIHTAGMVRGRKDRKFAASDWMALEQERGISVTSSAMQFPYKNAIINVLDTPGHEDFSEDTYRTLTAADCAIMVIDAAKGVEKQTRKLFEVCRLRQIPVLSLINKMDMPGREPLDLMNEIEEVLQIQSFAANWPIGRDRHFQGVYDRLNKTCLFFSKKSSGGMQKAEIRAGTLDGLPLSVNDISAFKEELDLLDIAGNNFSKLDFRLGKVTPVFFGSALINYGLEPFFDALVELAPAPKPRLAIAGDGEEFFISPEDKNFSAFVFKIQTNMNKKHRDSTAFLRICSGVFTKDLVVKHQRLKKEIRLSRPHGMMAKDREIIEEAYPGDIIGVINPGVFAIGDSVSTSGGFTFQPLPQFQPEIFAKVLPKDIKKRKSFDKGIAQFMQEGAIQLLCPPNQYGDNVLAAVGNLQFEVLKYRLLDEYGVDVEIMKLPYQCSAWIEGDESQFKLPTSAMLLYDQFKRPIVLFSNTWEKDFAQRQNPNHRMLDMTV